MARSRFSFALALCSLICAVPLAIVSRVERAAVFLWSLIVPAFASRPSLDLDFADRQVAFAGDCPVDAFVSNSLRHEAGMRRLI